MVNDTFDLEYFFIMMIHFLLIICVKLFLDGNLNSIKHAKISILKYLISKIKLY